MAKNQKTDRLRAKNFGASEMNLPTWAGAEMIRMEDEHSVSMYASSKDAEIARLGVQLAQAEADLMLMRRDRDAYHASMMKAEAENERLREALTDLVAVVGHDSITAKARQALRGESD
jgi:hypothetical protein